MNAAHPDGWDFRKLGNLGVLGDRKRQVPQFMRLGFHVLSGAVKMALLG
jgi:hypothetical protein